MPTSIAFTDGVGAATLTNGKPVPSDRFRNWVPDAPVTKSEAFSLATGQPYPFVFSSRYTVTLTLDKIPQASQATVLRLIAWLEQGGVITVNTGDAATRVYSQCYLNAGSRPQFSLSDAQLLEYSLTLSLLNVAGAAMLCQY